MNESDDTALIYYRTGYIIKYKNSLILRASKLQSKISLYTTEAEDIALSQATREIIPIMEHPEKLEKTLHIESKRQSVKCKVIENNSGAIKLARAPKFRPRTKHVALKYQ